MNHTLGEDIHMVIEGLYLGNSDAIYNVERLKMLVSRATRDITCSNTEHIPRTSAVTPTPGAIRR